jgi:hypothetical protein
MKPLPSVESRRDRRHFIGGSDARVIMGQDEKALIRLWQEKRGEVGPEDLSGNLIVQLGLATEDLNRAWYERNTGRASPRNSARFSCVSSACEHASLLPLHSLARIRSPPSPRRGAFSRPQPPILRDAPSRNPRRSTTPQMPPPQAEFGSCPATRVRLGTVRESWYQQFLLTAEKRRPINNFC